MPHLRLRLAVLAFLLAFPALAADPAVRAKDLLAALKAGELERAAVPFDSAMKAALPPSALGETWAGLKGQVGELKSEGPLRMLQSNGMTTILQKLTFSAAELDLRVAVNDATGEIAGLFFTPASDEGRPLGDVVGSKDVASLPADVKVAPAPAAPVDPAAIASTLLDDLARGRFADAVTRFDTTLGSMLPADKLGAMWADLADRLGALKERGEPKLENVSGAQVVTQRLTFAGGSLDMKVSVNAAGRVAGLFFAPVTAASAPPPAGAPFHEKPITVGEGGGALEGLLTLPMGEGPFPLVVLVHGSGPQDRDETIGPNKPFRDIAWGLAERGVASIRYDKRTHAHQQAMARMSAEITLDQETVLDAAAAIRQARGLPGIDPARVVLLGHSLGAMAAPRIAQRSPGLAGIVFVAAPAEALEDAILRQTEFIAAADGTIDATEREGIEATRRQVAAVKSPELSPQTPSLSLPLGVPARYWLDLRAHDPLREAAALPLPMLFVQGGRDYQVTMDDFAAWRAALAGRKDVRFASFPGLNHLLIHGTAKAGPEDYLVEGRVAPEALDAIAGFARTLR